MEWGYLLLHVGILNTEVGYAFNYIHPTHQGDVSAAPERRAKPVVPD